MEETLLYQLLARLAAGELSEAEKELLSGYFKDDSGKEALLAFLAEGLESADAASFDEERYLPLLKDILEADKQAPVVSMEDKPSRFRRWWWVAAAVLLFVAGAVAVVVNRRRTADEVVIADAVPGRNQATLTLSNGSRVLLDSANNGVLTAQGGSWVVKADSGQLAYTNGDSKGEDSVVVWNELSTPRGGTYQLTLADGTKVWLNAASTIRYPVRFGSGDREVSVSGEAYFEVAKDSRKPFRVHSGEMIVDVLGTRFNVNAYADEASIRTTLLEGSVRVSKGESVVLRPGEQAEVNGSVSRIGGVDLDEVMAWKNGFFVFRNADLSVVLRQLSRWYDLDVVYEAQVPAGHFSGKIPRDAMASQVLSLLEKNQVHFRIEGKKIIVRP